MRPVHLFSFAALSLFLFFSFGAEAACVYKKVDPARVEALKKKEAEISARKSVQDPQKMGFKDWKNSAVIIGYCQAGNVPNDVRHLWRELTEKDGNFKEEFSKNPDVALHAADEGSPLAGWIIGKFKIATAPAATLATGKALKWLIGGAAISLGAVVNSACAMNLEMMLKGYSHKERVDYFNEVFAVETERWQVTNEKDPTCGSNRKRFSKSMQFGWDFMRHQVVGASQVLEMIKKVAHKEKIDLAEIDIGEDHDHGHDHTESSPMVVHDHGPVKKNPSASAQPEHDHDHDHEEEHAGEKEKGKKAVKAELAD